MFEIERYENIVPNCCLFVDRRCFPGWEIIKQKINFHDLTFVVEGKGSYYVDDKKYEVRAGDFIYIPAGSLRQAHSSTTDPMHSYAFNFYLEPDNGLHLPFDIVNNHQTTGEIIISIREFNQVWMSKQPGYQIHAKSLILLIIYRLLTSSYHHSSLESCDLRIKKVKEYIIDHYSEDLDLDRVASVVNLHPVYLSKLFKKNTNSTFKEFLTLIRINNAEMILSTGGFSVTDVAERCGYEDISYFSNVFKSIKGYPPSFVLKKK